MQLHFGIISVFICLVAFLTTVAETRARAYGDDWGVQDHHGHHKGWQHNNLGHHSGRPNHGRPHSGDIVRDFFEHIADLVKYIAANKPAHQPPVHPPLVHPVTDVPRPANESNPVVEVGVSAENDASVTGAQNTEDVYNLENIVDVEADVTSGNNVGSGNENTEQIDSATHAPRPESGYGPSSPGDDHDSDNLDDNAGVEGSNPLVVVDVNAQNVVSVTDAENTADDYNLQNTVGVGVDLTSDNNADLGSQATEQIEDVNSGYGPSSPVELPPSGSYSRK